MNFINNYGVAGQHAVGVYLDDNTSGVSVTGNIISGTGSDGVQVHGGSNNAITGNIIDVAAGGSSAVLFQANPANEPNPSPLQHNTVSGNILATESHAATGFIANIAGGNPLVSGNDYFGPAGATLLTTPDRAPSFQNPGFASAAGGNYSMANNGGIGFAAIDQSLIGLHPTGPAAY